MARGQHSLGLHERIFGIFWKKKEALGRWARLQIILSKGCHIQILPAGGNHFLLRQYMVNIWWGEGSLHVALWMVGLDWIYKQISGFVGPSECLSGSEYFKITIVGSKLEESPGRWPSDTHTTLRRSPICLLSRKSSLARKQFILPQRKLCNPET